MIFSQTQTTIVYCIVRVAVNATFSFFPFESNWTIRMFGAAIGLCQERLHARTARSTESAQRMYDWNCTKCTMPVRSSRSIRSTQYRCLLYEKRRILFIKFIFDFSVSLSCSEWHLVENSVWRWRKIGISCIAACCLRSTWLWSFSFCLS